MPQTALENPMVVGVAGQLADLQATSDGDVVSGTNEESVNSIPFGCMCKSSSLEGITNVAALADVQNGKGILVYGPTFDVLTQLAQVTVNTNAQSAILPTVTAGVLRKGRIYVIPEATGLETAGVHVRISANGGNTQVGSFTTTADVGHTVNVSSFARWKGPPTLGQPSIVEIDMTNSALATAD